MTDIVVALFVAVLVLGGLHVPEIADAAGRALRRRARDDRPEGGERS